MRKFLLILFGIGIFNVSFAQNEARFGLFTGIYNSSLLNANDQHFGDYLPTIKMMGGLDVGYFVNLGKIPLGMNLQLGYWKQGQDYKGTYADGSSYEAYARLNYYKANIAFHTGTNIRRKVAFRLFGGIGIGFLNNYQDRYENYRPDAEKFIFEIKGRDVYMKDDKNYYGKISDDIYYGLDYVAFYGAGFDIKVTDYLIFQINGRFDMGLLALENENKLKITYSGETVIQQYPPDDMAIKYNWPTRPDIKRSATTNQTYGVFFGLSYRLYNKDKVPDYFK